MQSLNIYPVMALQVLPLHHIDIVNVDTLFVLEECDHQRQTYRSLGSCNSHNEQNEYLTIEVFKMSGEST
jgi:peptide subunit release factor 1 (eRF1)